MRDTRAWHFHVWASFGVAVFLCATGLAYLPGQALDRACLGVSWLCLVTSTFTLAKTLRDRAAAAK